MPLKGIYRKAGRGTPVTRAAPERSRGQMTEVEVGQGYGYTEDGQFGQVYNYRFRSNEIRDPLREAVNDHGWGWKAVSFKL